jgi:hypothetical protein
MKLRLLLILLLLLPATAYPSETKPLFQIDQEKLQAYEIQIFDCTIPKNDDSNLKQVDGFLLIDARPDEVWEVIKDWRSMADLVSDVEYYKTIVELKPIVPDEVGQLFIECKISIPLYDFLFTLDVQFDQSRFQEEWQLIKPEDVKIYSLIGIPVKNPTDTIKDIKGQMAAEPYANGEKTVYRFSMTTEFSTVLPEFVESYMVQKLLTEHLQGVKKKVESHGLYTPKSFFELPF